MVYLVNLILLGQIMWLQVGWYAELISDLWRPVMSSTFQVEPDQVLWVARSQDTHLRTLNWVQGTLIQPFSYFMEFLGSFVVWSLTLDLFTKGVHTGRSMKGCVLVCCFYTVLILYKINKAGCSIRYYWHSVKGTPVAWCRQHLLPSGPARFIPNTSSSWNSLVWLIPQGFCRGSFLISSQGV